MFLSRSLARSCAELKKKVEEMFKTEVAAIKYQLLSLSEDLDVLISVTGDDDLAHMLEEYDRLEMKRSPTTSPRFRVYVFAPQAATSPRPVPTLAAAAMPASSRYNAGFSHQHQHHTHHHHHHYQQQQHHHHFPTAGERYVVTVPGTPSGLSPPYPSPAGTVSAGNSPRASAMAADSSTLFESPSVRRGMQRVRSSPNLGSMVDVAAQYLHQHSTEADLCGCGGRDGPGPLVHNSMSGKGYLQQYAQPHMMYPAGSSGRYVPRAGNYHAPPMVPVSRSPDRPFSRGGPVPHGGEMLMAKKPLVWD